MHSVQMVVLDEADEMLQMGFREDIEQILHAIAQPHQTVMFSATMPKPILDLTQKYMCDPEMVEVGESNKMYNAVQQWFVYVQPMQKTEAMVELYRQLTPKLSIIFCNTKKMVDQLSKVFAKADIAAQTLHGDMRQSERKKVMDQLRSTGSGLLIATDVAARGIDLTDVNVVFNYDLPKDTESYIHRIGRTARAGKSGSAFSIITTKQQRSQIENIAKETSSRIEEFETVFTLQAKERGMIRQPLEKYVKKSTTAKRKPSRGTSQEKPISRQGQKSRKEADEVVRLKNPAKNQKNIHEKKVKTPLADGAMHLDKRKNQKNNKIQSLQKENVLQGNHLLRDKKQAHHKENSAIHPHNQANGGRKTANYQPMATRQYDDIAQSIRDFSQPKTRKNYEIFSYEQLEKRENAHREQAKSFHKKNTNYKTKSGKTNFDRPPIRRNKT